jgi:ATP-dependent Clp protease ATP-binding subunit ClpB
MNLDRFTISSTKRLQEAEALVQSFSHPAMEPIHLVAAMLTAPESITHELFRRLGIDENILAIRTKEFIEKLPQVETSNTMAITQEMAQVLDFSDVAARTMRDQYITEEHLFLSIIEVAKSLKTFFKEFALTAAKWKKVVEELRGGEQVTSNDAENMYESLKKYTIDLVELAKK